VRGDRSAVAIGTRSGLVRVVDATGDVIHGPRYHSRNSAIRGIAIEALDEAFVVATISAEGLVVVGTTDSERPVAIDIKDDLRAVALRADGHVFLGGREGVLCLSV
jgi:hypothetical protein